MTDELASRMKPDSDAVLRLPGVSHDVLYGEKPDSGGRFNFHFRRDPDLE